MPAFTISRAIGIDAPAETVHALVNDLREWQKWSPWEGLDPDLMRTYTGPDAGVGAHYAWSGNKNAGEGTMEIVGSTPAQIQIDLVFTKPWESASQVAIDLTPKGDGTVATWTMTGQSTALMTVMRKLFRFDNALGKDFMKGLTQLKAAAETPSA